VSENMSLRVLNQLSRTSTNMQSDSRRKYTALSVVFIVFMTSEIMEQGVNIKFCVELKKMGRLPYIKIKTETIISR